MKAFSLWSISIGVIAVLTGCRSETQMDLDRKAIIAILEQNVSGLLASDAAAASGWAGADSLWLVTDGDLHRRSALEVRSSYERQFLNGRFVRAEVSDSPEIHFSPDGQLAWYVQSMELTYEYADSAGILHQHHFRASELAVLSKRGGSWATVASAETYRTRRRN